MKKKFRVAFDFIYNLRRVFNNWRECKLKGKTSEEEEEAGGGKFEGSLSHKGLRDDKSKGEKMRLGYRLPCGRHAWWKAYIRRMHHSVEQLLVAARNCPGGKDETTSESEAPLLIDTRV